MSCWRTDQIVGERGELFNSADRHIVDALILTLLDEGVVDLTCRIRLKMVLAVAPPR